MIFPAGDHAKVMQPGEQTLYFPAAPMAVQSPPVLRRRAAAHANVGCNQLHAVVLAEALVQRVAVVRLVANQNEYFPGAFSRLPCRPSFVN